MRSELNITTKSITMLQKCHCDGENVSLTKKYIVLFGFIMFILYSYSYYRKNNNSNSHYDNNTITTTTTSTILYNIIIIIIIHNT